MKLTMSHVLREAVFGAQDGLVSTMGAVMGVAAGTQSRTATIISGLVVVAVESLSMAAGSYLSSKSQREMLERMLRDEEESIARDPEGERREIWEMYRARGYTDEEIAIVEKRLFSDKRLLLEDMAHKELGICPASFETPMENALVMGALYVGGGIVPVLPYLAFPLGTAMTTSVTLTMAALFAAGAAKGRMVGKSSWRSGLEMLGIGGAAAFLGYTVGRLASLLPAAL